MYRYSIYVMLGGIPEIPYTRLLMASHGAGRVRKTDEHGLLKAEKLET